MPRGVYEHKALLTPEEKLARELARRRSYYQQNREALRAKCRLYYQQNRDALRARQKEYEKERRAKNPDRSKIHYHQHKEQAQATARRRWHAIYRYQRYGLSKADFEALLELQEGKCAICSFPFEDRVTTYGRTVIHVDHAHPPCNDKRYSRCAREEVRGLLCGNCNRALGQFKSDPKAIIQALVYLGEPPARKLNGGKSNGTLEGSLERPSPSQSGDIWHAGQR